MGFLGVLEGQLGLGGYYDANCLRAARLVQKLGQIRGFWDQSAKVDPFGCARTLLSWRDTLWMCCWNGAGQSPRLKELFELTREVPLGVPDRFVAATERINSRRIDIGAIHLFGSRDRLPGLLQKVLTKLESAGSAIFVDPLLPAQSKGDLLAARMHGFAPMGDGTLQLLRPQGPLAAAEEVAAWLAPNGEQGWRDTVFVGGDPILDAALHRHGLPRLGLTSPASSIILVEILPLVIAMGWSPPDPERALELLTLPEGPVPHKIARRLVDALREWPAVGNDVWQAKLKEGLDETEEDRRDTVTQRLEVLFKPSVKEGSTFYPRKELESRVKWLDAWLRGKREHESGLKEWWDVPIAQGQTFLSLVGASGLDNFTASQIRKVVEGSKENLKVVGTYPAEAGFHAVGSPAAVAGEAKCVVWWDFSRNMAGEVRTLPLWKNEREELSTLGVRLPDPRESALDMNEGWRRPLTLARDRLMLVCPHFGSNGEPQNPHPLWDEIVANAALSVSVLTVEKPLFRRQPVMRTNELLPLPTGRGEWQIPADYQLKARELESPSGAASLAGCPFGWVLHYLCGIREGQTDSLPNQDALVGSVAHKIIAMILTANGVMDPEKAEAEANRLFDEYGPRLAASLFLPENKKQKARSRRMTSRGASALMKHLTDAGLTKVIAVEKEKRIEDLGTEFEGRPDLVVGPDPTIIDLKSGSEGFHRESLEDGSAVQLASYSHLFEKDGHFPSAAYFILKTRRLFTTAKRPFPDANLVSGPDLADTWRALKQLYTMRWKEIEGHTVASRGQRGPKGEFVPSKSQLKNGELNLTPPCEFCGFELLCGWEAR
jgi:hypothetical protein